MTPNVVACTAVDYFYASEVSAKVPWQRVGSSTSSDVKMALFIVGWSTRALAWPAVPAASQVTDAVGFLNQRLDIPSAVVSQRKSIILSCWESEPQQRPAFQECLKMLQEQQRQYAVKSFGMQRSIMWSGGPCSVSC